MAANVKFIRTSKEKQNNRQLTNQFDHSALYFVTDSRQLYRADQLLTSGIRIVDNYQALPSLENAAEEILYFTKAQGNGYTLQADRSKWLLVFESNKTFLDQIASTYVTKEAFDTKIEGIEEAIANIQAAQQLERQLRQVQTKVGTVESTVQEVTGTVQVVATTVTQVVGTVDQVASTVNQVTSKVQTIDSTVVQVATKVETIDSTVATIAPVVDQVASCVDELQACIDGMDTVHAELRAGIDAKVDIADFTPVKQQSAGNNVKILALDEQLFGVKQTIETLATKGELEEAIAAIQHPTVDLDGYATEAYVDGKVAEINVPGKVSDLENDLGYLTEHQDISHLATTESLTAQLNKKADKEHEHSQYLTEHQDLTDYAKKSDIPDISGKADVSHTHQEYLTELPEHSHEEYLTQLPVHTHEDYANKTHEHSLAEITDYVAPDLSEYAKKSQIPDTSNLATKDQLSDYSKFSGSYNDLTNKPEIPNVPTNVSAFTNDAGYLVENDLGDYAKKTQLPDVSSFITVQDVQAKGYVTAPENDSFALASQLAEKANIQHNHDDTYAKLNDIQKLQSQVLFSENYYVTKPIGDFVLGQNVNNLTIRKLFETLLGLSTTEPSAPDEPDTPAQPEGIVEEIISNKTPMYSVNAQDKIAAISYDDIIIYNQTTAGEQPTESGFYQITDDAGKVIESGYQELTVNNPDIPYIIALPVGVDFETMVTTQTYDTLESKWKYDPFEMSNDFDAISELCAELGVDISHINTDQYTLFADLEGGPTGKIHRFIITE